MPEDDAAPDGERADQLATSLALAGASREEADAFLREQRALARLQARELDHELGLRHWSLWVRHASGVLKLGLELAVGLLLLALVAGVSLMVWSAAHSDGLVIESFSVPPDLAARGMNGEVIAGQVLDRVTEMNATRSNRAAKSYANDWGDDIKVEIPDTGVSVGEAYRFLKSWLGHETHVSGEIWRPDNGNGGGIAITARVTGGSGTTFTGPSIDLPALVQKAAENIYGQTQPYRYAVFLARNGRREEALPLYKSLALTGATANDRGWAYLGWTNSIAESASAQEVEKLLLRALPYNVTVATGNLAATEFALGHDELALAYERRAAALGRKGDDNSNPVFAAANQKGGEANLSASLGAWHDAAQSMTVAMSQGVTRVTSPSYQLASFQIGEHDLAGARASVVSPLPTTGTMPVTDLLLRPYFEMQMAQAQENWAGVVSRSQTVAVIAAKTPGTASRMPTWLYPQLAYAQARLGNIAAAQSLIGSTLADCYPCLRARAGIAELRGQQARADFWFARAAAAGPSIPFADSEWGTALLKRGQPDAAIEKFQLANSKGPHFADPLEGWGEALMAKNQSHLALEKFGEANKYAPAWGRLHLKWGEALVYAGKPDEAKTQFARAAALVLTPSEKSELGRRGHV